MVWETSGLRLVVWRLVHYRQTMIPWANKWYRSCASAVVILTDGDDRRFEVGRWQWHCHSCLATTGGSCPHGTGGQRHHLADADSH